MADVMSGAGCERPEPPELPRRHMLGISAAAVACASFTACEGNADTEPFTVPRLLGYRGAYYLYFS